jgi:hypothetical protein
VLDAGRLLLPTVARAKGEMEWGRGEVGEEEGFRGEETGGRFEEDCLRESGDLCGGRVEK